MPAAFEKWPAGHAFHGPLCDYLQYSPTIDRLVVMARGHLKTTIAGTYYPLWHGMRNSNVRILLVCNTFDNAVHTLNELRGLVATNDTIHTLFPEVIPKRFSGQGVRWGGGSACLARTKQWPEATWEAAGVGTKVTRRHYDGIIEDDTIAPGTDRLTGEEMLPTQEQIHKAVSFHRYSIPLLISPSPHMKDPSWRIHIGTRWTFYDTINHIQEREMEEAGGRYSAWDTPALKEDGTCAYKRFSPTALKGIKQGMGSYMFSALYLNNPLASEFMIFRPEWLRYFTEDADGTLYIEHVEGGKVVREKVDVDGARKCITVDPADAPTGSSSQNYSVALSGLNCRRGLFVRGYERGRFTNAELIRKTLSLAKKHGVVRIRIERDRYPHLKAGFKLEMNKRGEHYLIEEVHTRGRHKEDRIMRLAPLAENATLFLKRDMGELENELYQFSAGRTDDIIDALAWQVLDNYQVPTYEVHKGGLGRDDPLCVTFEDIRNSVRRAASRSSKNYPFDRQLQRVSS